MPQVISGQSGISTYELPVSGYDTIPALRSQPMADSPTWTKRALALTFGSAAAMDGTFGFYAWDPTSVAADNGTTVIKPDNITGPGRWRQILGGGGTGIVCAEGLNYCFTGACPNQVLKIKNLDTGLANAIHTIGADGDQTIELDVGTSC